MSSAPQSPVRPAPSVDEARRLLISRDLINTISPNKLVASANELGLSLEETLAFLARVTSGGQGQGPFPETKDALMKGVK